MWRYDGRRLLGIHRILGASGAYLAKYWLCYLGSCMGRKSLAVAKSLGRYSGWILFTVILLAVFFKAIYFEEAPEPTVSCATGTILFNGFPTLPNAIPLPAKACWNSEGLITILNPDAPTQGIIFEPGVPTPFN